MYLFTLNTKYRHQFHKDQRLRCLLWFEVESSQALPCRNCRQTRNVVGVPLRGCRRWGYPEYSPQGGKHFNCSCKLRVSQPCGGWHRYSGIWRHCTGNLFPRRFEDEVTTFETSTSIWRRITDAVLVLIFVNLKYFRLQNSSEARFMVTNELEGIWREMCLI